MKYFETLFNTYLLAKNNLILKIDYYNMYLLYMHKLILFYTKMFSE